MKTSRLMFLYVIALIIFSAAMIFQSAPGYMDADYYFGGGLRLVNGEGLTENILWNYLDNPSGLPHPSHTYWMPLPSILAADGMIITGLENFFGGRFLFVLFAAAIPVLIALLSYRISKSPNFAITAALLGLFSGFYFVYYTITETFVPYMIFGGLFLLVAFPRVDLQKFPFYLSSFGLGLITGLMHLTRADGVLWFAAAVGLRIFSIDFRGQRSMKRWSLILLTVLSVSLGYFIIMGFWYGRNLQIFGSLFPPGSSQTLWITEYNQIFKFPVENLNFQTWMAAGWRLHFQTWLSALSANLKTMLAVQGMVFLFPLMLTGIWITRKEKITRFCSAMWVVTFIFMTIPFPFAGSRGGFLHSATALQPFFWSVVPIGLSYLVEKASRFRKWNLVQAKQVFSVGIVGLSIFYTGIVYDQVVIGPNINAPSWEQGWKDYKEIKAYLDNIDINRKRIVMVNNPPGYFVANQDAAIVIPDGDLSSLMESAKKYHAEYLILDKNYPQGLKNLYDNPEDQDNLEYITTIHAIHIFKFLN